MGYNDVMIMPTYERRLFLDFLYNDNREEKEHVENMVKNQTRTSKGHRTTRLSGDAVKKFAKEHQ